MENILYTTHCPKCAVLASKLQDKNIPYTEVTDIETMKQKGFMSVPYLEVKGQILNFKEAIDWVNNYKEE